MTGIYTGMIELTLDHSLFVPEESSGSNEESTKVATGAATVKLLSPSVRRVFVLCQ